MHGVNRYMQSTIFRLATSAPGLGRIPLNFKMLVLSHILVVLIAFVILSFYLNTFRVGSSHCGQECVHKMFQFIFI